MNLLPVIMSGGSGTRLWPVSRSKFPKQFCELLDKPLHTMTLNRLKKYGKNLIVTNIKFQDLTESDIRKNNFNVEKVLYEPTPRNTAAAIGLVCKYLQFQNKLDQVVGVFSSDNLILDEKAFHEALAVATKTASTGAVVVLGIKPSRPETGFGYIQVQNRAIGTKQATEVLKFHEKPSVNKANEFLNAGTYFWNAGIFIFRVENMIQHFKRLEPEIWNHLENLKPDLSNLNEVYKDIKNISIDYAILEKLTSPELMCVTCDIGWSDLGSWDSLMDIREGVQNKGLQNIQVSSKNNSVFPIENKAYSFVGVDDLMVIDTADALLVCKKDDSQKVKEVVDRLKANNSQLTEAHVFENRPWGKFEILKDQDYYKSKIIRVDAGQKISYQSHAKRAEHWIIVRGEAVVILNDQEVPLKTGQHIFIPQGAKHRIINNSNAAVEFIEVQVGSYFGEDDIVRYQDDYGRN
ncbi:MAG: mannose-1-phosphate guanylyltransferase/mannose-6-phosphate isomerase [Bdellovibrionota bacterium]